MSDVYDGGAWRGISRAEWVARIDEARIPLCPRCAHPWVMHVPSPDLDGYACRACRCRRRHPPATR